MTDVGSHVGLVPTLENPSKNPEVHPRNNSKCPSPAPQQFFKIYQEIHPPTSKSSQHQKKKHPKLPKKSILNTPTPPLPPSPRPVPGPRKPPNAPGRPGDVGTVVQNFVDNPMYQWICHGYHTFENAYHPIIDVVLHITNGWFLRPQLGGLLVALHADQSCKYVRSRVKYPYVL